MAEHRHWILAIFLILLVVNRRADGGIEDRGWHKKHNSQVVVFLKEQCYESDDSSNSKDSKDSHMDKLQEYIKMKNSHLPGGVEISFLPKTAVCELKSRGLSAILDALAQDSTKALIGSMEEDLCEVTSRLANMWGKPLLSWSCPQITKGTQRLVPSLEETANAIVAVAKMLSWKSIVIITSDIGWWPVLANKIEVGLQELGVAPRHIYWENDGHPKTALRGLQNTHARAIILCSSLRSSTGETILQTIDSLRLSTTIILAIDVSSFIPFLPKIVTDEEKKKGLEDDIHEYMQDAPHHPDLDYSNSVDINDLSSSKFTHPPSINLNSASDFLSADRTNVNSKSIFDALNNSIQINWNATSESPYVGHNHKSELFLPDSANDDSGGVSSDTPSGVESSQEKFDTNTSINDGNFTEDKTANFSYTVNTTYAQSIDLDEKRKTFRNITPSEEREESVIGKNNTDPQTGRKSNLNDKLFSESKNTSDAKIANHNRKKRNNDEIKMYRIKRSWPQDRYEMFENISSDMKHSLMLLTSMDSKNIVSDVFMMNSTPKYEVYEHVIEGLNIVAGSSDNSSHKVFKFLFLDWQEGDGASDSHWRPLLILKSSKNTSWMPLTSDVIQQGDTYLNIVKVQPNFEMWFAEKGLEIDDDACVDDFCISAQIKMNSTHIIIIVVAAFLFCVLTIGIALIIRNILLKKRLSKGPNKVVLTATDFVFPQVPDSRRVDEGIEAMLCCWLQQLQEFGGPEVDKPDLLKGSVGSLKGLGATKGPSSNGSLAKNNYIVDHRIRYNGDLVQLKELPTVGTFELKSKAMDCLVLTQGLRHENLNAFIGCLTDPARPALVHEHCSRGSLEDVLMMDEIKLDWSFRLSLLTDLVRGMRYLHSTPLKVHGYLTSRNCVIDARWVLKVTDYGMPVFYEAQGIQPTSKSARDLLWTAPELLRNFSLRRKGSQPGDVYSFAIIMQEVVVRGEPFCMLALSPEEIIEKVKKPPPLIRPSVSKGAAPPEAIHIMRQCWTEQPEMRPDFCQVHDLFRKLNHGRKVNFVDTMFQMLEKYSNNLEELIKERTEQLDMEKKKTEQLLNRMLPSYVAEKLKLGMPVDPEEFSEVSIYFSDIVGFTAISAHCTPFQVVDLLNDLYTCFDATINAYNVYKVETIGDAYMVVGGLPVRVPDHAEQVATMALDLLHQSGRFKIRHLPRTPLHLRIGLHTGPCCAGVVGLTMPRYCLFGDTVNTASRMESTGSAWRIHLSQATRDKLEAAGGYSLEYRGRTEVKGKGRLPTYWLLGKAGFDKALPSPPPIGLEETLAVNQNNSAQLGENLEVISAQTSPGHSTSEDKNSHHFSIDKSFFSIENTSPKSEIFNPTSAKIMNAASVERKSPIITETPKNSQDVNDSGAIPTITTECDEEQALKIEVPNQNKLPLNINQMTQLALGTPVSASEVAAALLGNSSTSLVSNRYKDVAKYKRSLMFEGTDLSTPYNHYRCLSPSDSNISQLNQSRFGSGSEGRQNSGRMLKRQFSLDRADDSGSVVPESNLANQNLPRVQPRLCKQNSAGAATDLERIEEVPLAPVTLPSPRNYKRLLGTGSTFPGNSKSVSNESLVAMDKR